jgi:hypothetical protein
MPCARKRKPYDLIFSRPLGKRRYSCGEPGIGPPPGSDADLRSRLTPSGRAEQKLLDGEVAYAAPIRMPTPSTMAPPRTIWNAACRNGVSM